eukprot:gene10460-2982_t
MHTGLKTKAVVQKTFSEIYSNKFLDSDHFFVKGIDLKGNYKDRSLFLESGFSQSFPPIVSKSEFVPNKMVEHLMKNKKRLALGVKFEYGDKITNMEGAMHTFVTPIINFVMTGDYIYKFGHGATSFKGKARNMVMSAAVQPDFEYDDVMLPLVKLSKNKVEGRQIVDFDNFKFFYEFGYKNMSNDELNDYEEKLKSHMIYNLTKDHELPSLGSLKNTPFNTSECIDYLENMIEKSSNVDLYGKYTTMGSGYVISLESLFNVYVEQIRNEFSVFESNLPQGYIYTINPPRIFASEIGQKNVPVLNRLQMLAFKHLGISEFKNLKGIGFDGFADSSGVSLLKIIFKDQDVEIKEKNNLLGDDGKYSSTKPYALIVHNNSDGFGENIKYEGVSSLDGAIGCFSNAACCLDCKRKDIVDFVM